MLTEPSPSLIRTVVQEAGVTRGDRVKKDPEVMVEAEVVTAEVVMTDEQACQNKAPMSGARGIWAMAYLAPTD